MTLRLVVPKETWTGERRVALDPSVAERFQRLGAEVQIERGAGCGSHFGDAQYEKGAKLVDDIVAALAAADVTVRVQPPSLEEVEQLRDGSVLIGFLAPHRKAEVIRRLRDKKIASLAFEMLPRISRAE